MRTLVWGVLCAAIIGVAIACSSTYPRDMYYGTDAGTDYNPQTIDAPVGEIDAPEEVDAGPD